MSEERRGFRVFIPGKAQGWQRAGRNGNHYYTKDETRAAENEIGWAARTHWKGPPSSHPFRVHVRVYVEPPKSWRGKKAEYVMGCPAMVKPDNDNIEKAVWDAMTGIVFLDDKQITDNSCTKKYGRPAGVVITVKEMDEHEADPCPYPSNERSLGPAAT